MIEPLPSVGLVHPSMWEDPWADLCRQHGIVDSVTAPTPAKPQQEPAGLDDDALNKPDEAVEVQVLPQCEKRGTS